MYASFDGKRQSPTMDRITTHGRFRAAMIARDRVVFPEPELPATPITLVFAHGGE